MVLYGFLIVICECGVVCFTVKELECVVIDLVFWRGRQSQLDRIEIVKNLQVDIIDTPVALVSYNHIKEMG